MATKKPKLANPTEVRTRFSPNGGQASLVTRKVQILPRMETVAPTLDESFVKQFSNEQSDVMRVLLNRPALTNRAAKVMDGRRIPLVFAIVRDKNGATKSGLEVRLYDSQDALVDS